MFSAKLSAPLFSFFIVFFFSKTYLNYHKNVHKKKRLPVIKLIAFKR
nr:MAG TPA: hypothetical protein [Crassvirales sp.]